MTGTGQPQAATLKFQRLAEIAVGATARVELSRVCAGPLKGRHVVVKRLHPHVADEPQFVDMFRDEAWMTGSLHHPHVVEVVGFGSDSIGPYLAVEFVRGVSLARLMKTVFETREMFGERLVVFLGACICGGLHAAHELRGPDGEWLALVHRDVTPGNVLVGFDGQVKLADFGLAKARQRLTRTLTGLLKGQPYYMAPEQIRSQPVDRRADVFAVGVLLFELFAGQRPWDASNDLEAMRASCEQAPADLRQLRPRMDTALVTLVNRCLEKDPAARYPTAGELGERLQKWLSVHGYRTDNDVALARFVRRNAMRQMRWFDRALAGQFVVRRPVQGRGTQLPVSNDDVTRQDVPAARYTPSQPPPPLPAPVPGTAASAGPELETEELGEIEDLDSDLFDADEGPTLIQRSRKARQVLQRLSDVLGWPAAADGEGSESGSDVELAPPEPVQHLAPERSSNPPEATTVRRHAVRGAAVSVGASTPPPPGRVAAPDPSAPPIPSGAVPSGAGGALALAQGGTTTVLELGEAFESGEGGGWVEEVELAAQGLAAQAEEAAEHAQWAVATAAAAAQAATVARHAVELARQSQRDQALGQLREAYRLQAGLVRGEAEPAPPAPARPHQVPWPEPTRSTGASLAQRWRLWPAGHVSGELLSVVALSVAGLVGLLVLAVLLLSQC